MVGPDGAKPIWKRMLHKYFAVLAAETGSNAEGVAGCGSMVTKINSMGRIDKAMELIGWNIYIEGFCTMLVLGLYRSRGLETLSYLAPLEKAEVKQHIIKELVSLSAGEVKGSADAAFQTDLKSKVSHSTKKAGEFKIRKRGDDDNNGDVTPNKRTKRET
jgi:hypothetical protein